MIFRANCVVSPPSHRKHLSRRRAPGSLIPTSVHLSRGWDGRRRRTAAALPSPGIECAATSVSSPLRTRTPFSSHLRCMQWRCALDCIAAGKGKEGRRRRRRAIATSARTYSSAIACRSYGLLPTPLQVFFFHYLFPPSNLCCPRRSPVRTQSSRVYTFLFRPSRASVSSPTCWSPFSWLLHHLAVVMSIDDHGKRGQGVSCASFFSGVARRLAPGSFRREGRS
ncbi:hypothetical protein R3P38DRAFT_323527 [Favolaschia claudopus]|uniref:Uncharacterized protein n=1 Tax=Favolaschia claudopus TaxID=2862362 RepID=A0AAW0CVZ4_9AGAR